MKNKEILWRSVSMWINYIETGYVSMSAQDAINCGRTNHIKQLDTEQKEFVKRLETLRDNILKSKGDWYD